MSLKTAIRQSSLGITDYSVLMQIRAAVLNALARRIPADHYSSRATRKKLTIYESENLDSIRNQTRLDFELAKKLTEENDKNPTCTPREVSAAEVLNAVAYYLMFLGLDESDRTQNRLNRMVAAEERLRSSLTLYVQYLNEADARPLQSALAVSRVSPTTSPKEASSETNGVGSTVSIKAKRSNLLTPLIAAAQAQCTDPCDTPSVWSKLREMAVGKVSPLIGATDEGLQWIDEHDQTKYLSIKNLRDRLSRKDKAAS